MEKDYQNNPEILNEILKILLSGNQILQASNYAKEKGMIKLSNSLVILYKIISILIKL